MPSKVKANAVATGSAGFLKPTFSSLRKVVEKPDDKLSAIDRNGTKLITEYRKISAKKFRQSKSLGNENTPRPDAQESVLHSSLATKNEIRIPHVPQNSINKVNGDAMDVDSYTKDIASRPKSLILEHNDDEVKIKDARRVCDELRMQIEDLKLQQKEFQQRIGQDLGMENGSLNKSDGNGLPSIEEITKCCDTPEAKEINKTMPHNDEEAVKTTKKPSNLKILSNIVDDVDSYITDDSSFNLHGSVTSSEITDFNVNDEWLEIKALSKDVPPNVLIKKLISERERYKKKVRHLQTALNKLKKHRSNSNSRTPDIAAHDIVYFNADLIGEGHLSYVYSGTVFKNQPAAIKKLIRPDMMSSSDRSYLAAEAGLLMTLHHQNIVEVYGVSTAPLQPLIVTELVKGKSLECRLQSSNGWPLTPVEYYSISRDSAVGMAYLHGQKPPVLHLNLRPCNILVDSNGRAKISDFGFSKIRLDAGLSNQVNLAYLAPELLTFPVHLTTKLDVYSYAMILWEMAAMKEPYANFKASQILDLVGGGKRLDIPCELPSGFHAIISRCWDYSALQRPSFKEVIILLETMILPEEWAKAIDSSELRRADTRGIVTPRDGRNGNMKAVAERKNVERPKHQELKRNGNGNSNRRRISDELALESDMMSLGYVLHKNDGLRHDSDKYLRGFSPKSGGHHSYPNTPTRGNSSRHRSLLTKLSPYKYSFLNTSPVTPSKYYGRYSSQNGERVFGNSTRPRYSAARNLNSELKAQADKGLVQLSDSEPALPTPALKQSVNQNDENHHSEGHSRDSTSRISPFVPSEKRKQYRLDIPGNEKATEAPLPLMDGDLRYHNQELSAETPKVVSGKLSNIKKPRSQNDEAGVPSPEDLKNAVSIPYLKNLRSGDEVSSSSSTFTSRSQFDEKLNCYVTDACHAESRNYVNAKGWRSDRSFLLNNPTSLPSSDKIKVHSMDGTSATLASGSRRILSSGISESPETILTAVFQPNHEKRRDLFMSARRDDIISFTSSDDNSVDSSHGVGVTSVPSTYLTNGINGDIQSSHGNFYRARQPSDSRATDGNNRRPSQSRYLRRGNSWNKLKNSYSPEPLIPHFASGFEGVQPGNHQSPTHPGNEHLTRPSAFSSLKSHSKHPSKSRRKDSSKSESTRTNNQVQDALPSNEAESNETDGGSTSTLSGVTNDELGETLKETANELAGVSGILQSAAEQRKMKTHNRKEMPENR